ncbi:DUF378 domain-containing protein [Patescibacteria group bacterium]|nr:DUF378 domain-containing protein [Patescibacteria group bacterium]
MKVLNWIVMLLVVVGGLNWGLVGFFNFDLVAAIFGDMSVVSRVVYALVGLSAVYMLFMLPKMNKKPQM